MRALSNPSPRDGNRSVQLSTIRQKLGNYWQSNYWQSNYWQSNYWQSSYWQSNYWQSNYWVQKLLRTPDGGLHVRQLTRRGV